MVNNDDGDDEDLGIVSGVSFRIGGCGYFIHLSAI